MITVEISERGYVRNCPRFKPWIMHHKLFCEPTCPFWNVERNGCTYDERPKVEEAKEVGIERNLEGVPEPTSDGENPWGKTTQEERIADAIEKQKVEKVEDAEEYKPHSPEVLKVEDQGSPGSSVAHAGMAAQKLRTAVIDEEDKEAWKKAKEAKLKEEKLAEIEEAWASEDEFPELDSEEGDADEDDKGAEV